MAFLLDHARLIGYEYRGCKSGVSQKSGKAWTSLRYESPDGASVDINVPSNEPSLVGIAEKLSKGTIYNLDVTAVATAPRGDAGARSYVQLRGVPQLAQAVNAAEVDY